MMSSHHKKAVSPNQQAQPGAFALFISDLHLQAEMPATTAAFLAFLEQHAIKAQRLYLLGDIFEYWAGDDDLASPFPQRIIEALRRISDAGVALFWIAGNRDFLVGKAFFNATNITLLPDTHLIEYASNRYLITHGDLLCTDDIAYQQFRAQVRQPAWQTAFLARPLEERKAIIATMRKQSQQHQQEHMQRAETIMDVNLDTVDHMFADNNAHIMIHGHTHRPALHQHGKNIRYVLSDWNTESEPTHWRGDWLALQFNGHLQRFNTVGIPIAETGILPIIF